MTRASEQVSAVLRAMSRKPLRPEFEQEALRFLDRIVASERRLLHNASALARVGTPTSPAPAADGRATTAETRDR